LHAVVVWGVPPCPRQRLLIGLHAILTVVLTVVRVQKRTIRWWERRRNLN
jgi:hypothetical protein